jgi:bacillithiol synthase
MDCTSTQLSYQLTGYFSRLVADYLEQSPPLRNFYEHEVTLAGIEAAIEQRKLFPTDRHLLQTELTKQYKSLQTTDKVLDNIRQLGNTNTFTVCTAHQPGIFTGNLYFVYKILHAIRMAEYLSEQYSQYHFVPVYYMGSEDADLDELGHIHMDGEKLVWDAQQQGAVGRMKTSGLEKLISQIEGQLSIQPSGKELLDLLKTCYLESPDIQTATFKLVNHLFGEYGLIVLLPDNPNFKRVMKPVFEDDLLQQLPSKLVEQSVKELDEAGFKVQAHPRDINLFYLQDQLRGRIVQNGSGYKVHDTTLKFSTEELQQMLHDQPDAFSPNVILRGLFQETILPDIAFIGGGGELAYWLELKGLFRHYNVPFPVLVLRNSFLFIEKAVKDKMNKLRISEADIFLPEQELLNRLVRRDTSNQLSIETQIEEARQLYTELKSIATNVDPTLVRHVSALEAATLNKLIILEKKLLKAEKRKFMDHQRQLHAIKQALFPKNSLQERVENFLPYYAKWGPQFLRLIYQHSQPLQGGFIVITAQDQG